MRKALAVCGLAVMFAAAPSQASADWLFTPFFGLNWGGTADFSEAGGIEDEFKRQMNFGASLQWMGGGVAGFELDFGYSPNFFESTESGSEFGDSNLTTLMGNIVFGIPIGGQTGGGIRPYVSGGAGIMKSHIDDAEDLFDADSTDWGFNVGGGITGFFGDNFGLRGDVRYFRALQDIELDRDDVDIDVGGFQFWRGTLGFVFRF